jgi:hypothetical protein
MQNQLAAAAFLLLAANAPAAKLTPAAQRQFEDYVSNVEARLESQHASSETYLAVPPSKAGEPRLEPVNGGTRPLAGALLHHWRGSALVPHATPSQMLALLRDFRHLSNHYAPQIVSSRVIQEHGDTATLAMRLKEQKVIMVVLDAEYRFESRLSASERGFSLSRSTHVWQVDNPGSAQERRRTEGDDDGFLWRLNSYWSFARVPGGLQIECEAVSLTRDVPLGLGWMIAPLLNDFPREALAFTLNATRNALADAREAGE